MNRCGFLGSQASIPDRGEQFSPKRKRVFYACTHFANQEETRFARFSAFKNYLSTKNHRRNGDPSTCRLFGSLNSRRSILHQMAVTRPFDKTTEIRSPLVPHMGSRNICGTSTRIPLVARVRGDFWREYFAQASTLQGLDRAAFLFYFFSYSTGLGFADCVVPICRWLEDIVKERLPSEPTFVVHQGLTLRKHTVAHYAPRPHSSFSKP